MGGWLMLRDMAEVVTVDLVVDMPDGSKSIGNSYECGVEEALELIKQDKAKHPYYSRGFLPDEWANLVKPAPSTKKGAVVSVVEEVSGGES